MNLQAQFDSMQKEFKKHSYPPLEDRTRVVETLKKALQKDAYLLADAVNKDFTHRSVDETLFLEVFTSIQVASYCLKKNKKWMKNRKREVSWFLKPITAHLSAQPLGVIGIMVPWNYPILLALAPALYALAAGNRVMIKMSELSTHTGIALQKMIKSSGLSKHIAVLNGDVEMAKEFSSLPFGHLIFTGSSKVGKAVMRAASDNLTPVTLELGGKSPVILSKSMNSNHFKRLFMGKLFNASQTCVAPDYILCPIDWENRIEEECKYFIGTHYPDLINNDNYSSIIADSHRQRLIDLVEDAQLKGARVVSYGDLNSSKNKLPFFLIFNPTLDMRVMQEEIFGPILPILTYKSFDEVLQLINSKPNPLSLYYFGTDADEIKRVTRETLSGALLINDVVTHVAIDDLPFGGIGNSGMGRYHGQEGFDTFSQLKPVVLQSKFAVTHYLYPPYGRLLKLFLYFVGGIKGRKK